SYSYDALEPCIDSKTMEIHHVKHHQGYIDKLNTVLEKYPDLLQRKLEDLAGDLHNLPMSEEDKKILKNNGGGHLNHSLFWQIMGPSKEINGALVEEIKKEFGSVKEFKTIFSQAAVSHFGSGWAWLVRDDSGKLKIYSLPNQDSPLMHPPHLNGHTPIICLDVWEHAYYLKYQNRRQEYVENWWKVLKLIE
ncbi:MAG: superoxide dismutase, partial [Candidatus Aenigmarchaeota archaeon]|nr:superoxide dismutase [Candidatus Aenigmarchaeota archaeon]